jgi:transcriptional regulator GlxA family with amidase domain
MPKTGTIPTPTKSFRVAGLLYDGALLLDLVGPLEAFQFASHELRNVSGETGQLCGYEIEYIAPNAGVIDSSIGLGLHAESSCLDECGTFDILVVPGQTRDDVRYRNPDLFGWLREQAKTRCRIMSVCSGAYPLAEAGVLAGHTITTHWAHGESIRQQHPDVQVLDKKLFHKDGRVYSSGGVSSGIDLALFMIEEDFGREIALRVAKRMVVYLRRQGDQSQFSDWLLLQAKSERLSDLLDWVERSLAEEISVEALAEECAMSPRNFARQFTRELDVTPMSYVQQRRVSYAKHLVETTTASGKEIARTTGFRSEVHFRRAFQRAYATTPMRHRAQFGPIHDQS